MIVMISDLYSGKDFFLGVIYNAASADKRAKKPCKKTGLNRSLALGQTSNFSCAEPNANELKQRTLLINTRFGT